MTTVTREQAQFVLDACAEWLGKQGLGIPTCPQGRTLGRYLDHEDGTPCEDVVFGPAPTGKDAAYRAEGPELIFDWDFPGQPTPTVLVEGAVEDWAIRSAAFVQRKADAAGLPVYVEPYFSFALSIYPR